jgi:hypothetical protein
VFKLPEMMEDGSVEWVLQKMGYGMNARPFLADGISMHGDHPSNQHPF